MKPDQPALIQTPDGLPSSKKPRFHWWHALILVGVAIAVVVIAMGVKLLRVSGQVFGGTNTSTLGQLGKLIVPGDRELKQDANHRTNILVAGYGGPGHDGAYLADTIIFVSINNDTNDVATLSIPRDFLVNLPGYGYRKINNALAFGMSKDNPHGGDAMLTDAVQQVTGQTVHYFAKIDFNGFKAAVDAVGGVDITVDNAFVDYEYPTSNYGYQTIRFAAGEQHMDGEKALEFVRSRHGTNGEGSDFARSKRQQKLLFALKEKALSLGTLTNPSKVSKLLDSLGNHVFTTFELWEVARLGSFAKDLTSEKIITRVLEATTDGLVRVGDSPDGAYVLQPRIGLGKYSEIQELAANIFTLNTMQREAAPIQVINATGVTGLGETVGRALRGFGYDVRSVASPKGVTETTTTLIDLSNGAAPTTLTLLGAKFKATTATALPTGITLTAGRSLVNSNSNGNVNSAVAPTPTVILVLGTDAVQLAKSMDPTAKN